MAGALTLQTWQWVVIGLAWVLFFLLPAVWMWRKAARDGDNPLIWSLLVAVGSFLGILEYYEHRSILKRRAKRAAKAKTPEPDSADREGEVRER